MRTLTHSSLSIAIAASAHLLTGSAKDHDPLLDLIGDAHFVLLGESTHGTHEFYLERARITRRLIEEKNFIAVAVEADWPDAYRVNRYVRGQGEDHSAKRALDGFKRFPTWMWRNTDVVDFVDWLRRHNDALPPAATPAGFYGLDLYSLFGSIDEVVRYLDQVDPQAAQRAREHYACFDHFDRDSQRYGYSAHFGVSPSCQEDVISQLQDLRRHADDYMRNDGRAAADALFHAQQNARLVANAEEYYRTMFSSDISSWNLRDRHMADTLDALHAHLSQTYGQNAKIVVWEHNSHIGDARASEVGNRGEWNVGQLVRERHGRDAFLVGFTTHHGTVSAAAEWGAPVQRKQVVPALQDSYEDALHNTGLGQFFLPLRDNNAASQALARRRLERAIGVIYRPETERQSHYFYASLPQQFDAVLHFDETSAVQPLDATPEWHAGEAPETFPSGI